MDARIVALLRGINVGTSKRVAMGALRLLLGELGYTDVATLLNSGNALFTCDRSAVRTAATDIERGVHERLGVECRVVLRTADEWAGAVEQAPLLDLITDSSRYFVGFLDAEPSAAGARTVAEADSAQGPDRIRLIGRELYLWCPAGLSASPLSSVNWDRALGVAVTMRNWKTVARITALL